MTFLTFFKKNDDSWIYNGMWLLLLYSIILYMEYFMDGLYIHMDY